MHATTNLITTLLNTGDGLSMVTMHGYNHGINNINKKQAIENKYEIYKCDDLNFDHICALWGKG